MSRQQTKNVLPPITLNKYLAASRRSAASERALQPGGDTVDFLIRQSKAAYYGRAFPCAAFFFEYYIEPALLLRDIGHGLLLNGFLRSGRAHGIAKGGEAVMPVVILHKV